MLMENRKPYFKFRNPFEETPSYDEWNIYKDYIQEDHIVYDLGANTGWMSEYFCQISKHVHAFEPVPYFFEKLKENTKEFSNITYHKTAVGEYNDPNIRIEGQRGSVKLTDYIEDKGLEFPDFIKVDVEGFETLFFKSIKSILEKGKTIFYVEMHSWLEAFKYSEEGGFDWNDLKKYDYIVKKFSWEDPDRIWSEAETLTLDQDFNPKRNETFCYLFIPKNGL
jgi:hypothetical protein